MTDQASLDAAILAMHAYNTSANNHVLGLSENIGDFTFISAQQSADGFYGAAYSKDGKTYITYRGTNIDEGITDPDNGFSLGAGSGADFTLQVQDAIRFYQGVSSEIGAGSLFDADITLVGHSLGGGLAGYIASIYGKDAYIYNNMSFESGAMQDYDAITDADVTDETLKALIYKDENPRPPSWSSVHAYATAGDFLAFDRLLQVPAPSKLETYGGSRNPITLHAESLQVDLQWASLFEARDWTTAAPALWDAYFDNDLASTIAGVSSRIGADGSASTVVDEGIAYSAIAEGVRPFGDTAIWAMFDDAADLSDGLSSSQVNGGLVAAKGDVARAVVEYAADLALSAKMNATDGSSRSGVLSEASDTMTLDFSASKWTSAGGETPSNTKDAIISDILSDSEISSSDLDIALLYYGIWHGTVQSGHDLISAITFLTNTNAAKAEVPVYTDGTLDAFVLSGVSVDIGSQSTGAPNLVLGASGTDAITGGDEEDYILSGGGDDQISTGAGNDYVWAGAGNDFVVGGSGDITVYGGDGNDLLVGGAGDDYLSGDAGDDILIPNGGGGRPWQPQYLSGGAGNDTFVFRQVPERQISTVNSIDWNGTADAEILDPEVGDRLIWNGYQLTGGAATIIDNEIFHQDGNVQVWEDVGWTDSIGTVYKWDTFSGRVSILTPDNTEIMVEDFVNGDLGIYLAPPPNGDLYQAPLSNIALDGTYEDLDLLAGRQAALATPGPIQISSEPPTLSSLVSFSGESSASTAPSEIQRSARSLIEKSAAFIPVATTDIGDTRDLAGLPERNMAFAGAQPRHMMLV